MTTRNGITREYDLRLTTSHKNRDEDEDEDENENEVPVFLFSFLRPSPTRGGAG